MSTPLSRAEIQVALESLTGWSFEREALVKTLTFATFREAMGFMVRAAFETAGLAKLNLIPKHVWEPALADMQSQGLTAQDFQEETPVGSGPFKFSNWARSVDVRVLLEPRAAVLGAAHYVATSK